MCVVGVIQVILPQVDTTVPYDARYALRVCQEEKVDRACVHIYSVMGLLEEAVQLALTVSAALCGPVGCVADGEAFTDILGPSRFSLTFNGEVISSH